MSELGAGSFEAGTGLVTAEVGGVVEEILAASVLYVPFEGGIASDHRVRLHAINTNEPTSVFFRMVSFLGSNLVGCGLLSWGLSYLCMFAVKFANRGSAIQ